MKVRIRITFKTKKGEEAYIKSCEKGKEQNMLDKVISKTAFGKEKIIHTNPLVIEIRPVISWVAIRTNLPQLIKDGLLKLDCRENIDFDLKVSYGR